MQAHEKVCDENKRNKEINDAHAKDFNGRMVLHKTVVMHLDEVWVNYS